MAIPQLQGGFACPICGNAEPHFHGPDMQERYGEMVRRAQIANEAYREGLTEAAAAGDVHAAEELRVLNAFRRRAQDDYLSLPSEEPQP